jgi:DNA repair protein RecN (Recombination protein N)
MILRFYLKNYLSFNEIDCEFKNGLIIFSGASGAGKSILMNSILSLFGHGVSKAEVSEVLIENTNIKDDAFMVCPNEDIIIKQTTSSKTRYLLNSQNISKKDLSSFTQQFSRHLHLKDTSDFSNHKLLDLLDSICAKNHNEYKSLQENFKTTYKQLHELQEQLNDILTNEQNLDELIEFTKFEIQKIESLNPKIGELNDLKDFKTKLSKKEKINDLLVSAQPVLNNSHTISQLLIALDINSAFFDDAINTTINHIEKFNDSFDDLCDNEIDNILTRIEELSKLEKKYGSLEDALEYKDKKIKELEKYDNITFDKAILEKNIKKAQIEIDTISNTITKLRKDNIPYLQQLVEKYLKLLFLNDLEIILSNKPLDITGCDNIEFLINNTSLKDISSGEFNRLRLALLTARTQVQMTNKGVLFLDEIDANLSGKESESIAKVLKTLSEHYQIFAISHQPQLSATANQHFLVSKTNNISTIVELNQNERVDEIARMISGENITLEARQFANTLLQKDNLTYY